MKRECDFDRRIESLPGMLAFAASGEQRIQAVELAIEELFTNMLKYGRPGGREVRIEVDDAPEHVEVTLVDRDVQPFDPVHAPPARTDLPLQQREPGGLGLHLVRRLVDSLQYEYLAASRESRTCFRVMRTRRGAASEPR